LGGGNREQRIKQKENRRSGKKNRLGKGRGGIRSRNKNGREKRK